LVTRDLEVFAGLNALYGPTDFGAERWGYFFARLCAAPDLLRVEVEAFFCDTQLLVRDPFGLVVTRGIKLPLSSLDIKPKLKGCGVLVKATVELRQTIPAAGVHFFSVGHRSRKRLAGDFSQCLIAFGPKLNGLLPLRR
jgi:hypothetical protein